MLKWKFCESRKGSNYGKSSKDFIDINALPNEARDYPLLSERFGIEPYQMIIFMETVEEKFEIRVPESAIGERKFNTFNDIVKIIIAEKGE